MPKLLEQVRSGVQRRGAGGVFLGVNVCVYVIGRFLEVRTRTFIGNRHQPNFTPQKGFSNARERGGFGECGGKLLQQRRQFFVVVKAVMGNRYTGIHK